MSMTASPPYPLTTPLANTRGIVSLLKPLCGQGNDWRDLAEALGFNYRDQMDIKKRSKDNDIHHLLVDCLINQYGGDSANIQVLLDALQKTGKQGREVVNQMIKSGLIRPLDDNVMTAAGAEGGDLLVSSVEDRTSNTRAPNPKNPTTNSGLAKITGLAGNHNTTQACPIIIMAVNVHQPRNVQFGDKTKAFFPSQDQDEEEDGRERGRCEHQDDLVFPAPGEEPPPNEIPRSIDGKEQLPNGMGGNFHNEEPPPNGMKRNTNNRKPPPKKPNEMTESVITTAIMAMFEAFLSLE